MVRRRLRWNRRRVQEAARDLKPPPAAGPTERSALEEMVANIRAGTGVALYFKAGTASAPFQRFPAIQYNDLLYLTTGILHVTTGLRGVRFSQNCPAPVIALYRWNGSLKHRP